MQTWWWLFAVWSLALACNEPGPVRERRQSPSSDPRSCGSSGCAGNDSTIPLSLAWQLSEVSNMNELVERFVTNKEDYYKSLTDDSGLALRMGESGPSNEVVTKFPGCITQPTLVYIPTEDQDIAKLISPHCIRINRCSGCCDNPVLECRPTETEEHSYRVSVFVFNEKGMISFEKWNTVSELEHIRCACQCRIQQKHCVALHVYRPEICRCVCTNESERSDCEAHNDRSWDESTCTCNCHELSECSTGAEFDHGICKCKRIIY